MSSNEQPDFRVQPFCELFGDVPNVDVIRLAAEQKMIDTAGAVSLGSYGTCSPCGGSMFVKAGSEIRLPTECPNRRSVQEYAGRVLLIFPRLIGDPELTN